MIRLKALLPFIVIFIGAFLLSQVSFAQVTLPSVNLGFKTTENPNEVVNAINKQPKPLALYLFTSDKRVEKKVLNELGKSIIKQIIQKKLIIYLLKN